MFVVTRLKNDTSNIKIINESNFLKIINKKLFGNDWFFNFLLYAYLDNFIERYVDLTEDIIKQYNMKICKTEIKMHQPESSLFFNNEALRVMNIRYYTFNSRYMANKFVKNIFIPSITYKKLT